MTTIILLDERSSLVLQMKVEPSFGVVENKNEKRFYNWRFSAIRIAGIRNLFR